MQSIAFTGARVFDSERWHDDAALLIRGDTVEAIVTEDAVPSGTERRQLDGGMLVPGFIDLQVNGGGGVLLNEDRSVNGLRTICAAHYQFGTTALLPTLITDTPEITAEAVAAGEAAVSSAIPGFLGLHLEGPHLSVARKGAHDPALIRPMSDVDLDNLVAARRRLPNLLVTVAAETVPPAQIASLADAGIIVSIGHSDAGFAVVGAAEAAGASMVTHLFNAQSQLSNREPGVVGAALHLGGIDAGLIADGIHVHPATIAAALRAKVGPGRIFLVTDAMSVIGTDIESFTLNGRRISRANGALRLDDGTLAGADLTMIEAIVYTHETIGLSLEEALRMASTYPASAMGIAGRHGALKDGQIASFVHLDDDLAVKATWIDGAEAWSAH
ncbi:MAG TPA: N-acetylglucosamine-6-phosphate deacetylase [Devosiaceae bacterium]|jgi:N-acetylglucosamine-6-phosphate deacetylase